MGDSTELLAWFMIVMGTFQVILSVRLSSVCYNLKRMHRQLAFIKSHQISASKRGKYGTED